MTECSAFLVFLLVYGRSLIQNTIFSAFCSKMFHETYQDSSIDTNKQTKKIAWS